MWNVIIFSRCGHSGCGSWRFRQRGRLSTRHLYAVVLGWNSAAAIGASLDQVPFVIRCRTALLLSCFRALRQQRTPPALERSKVYWSWSPILHTQGERGNLHKTLRPYLHLNSNRGNGIEILEAWMPTIKKHNSRRAVRQRMHHGIPSSHSWEKQHVNKYNPYLIDLIARGRLAVCSRNVSIHI